jgi:hypothetical protein
LGPERGDLHAALVAHTVASAMSTGKTKFKLADFIPRWSHRRQSADEQLAILRGLAAHQEGVTRVDHR